MSFTFECQVRPQFAVVLFIFVSMASSVIMTIASELPSNTSSPADEDTELRLRRFHLDEVISKLTSDRLEFVQIPATYLKFVRDKTKALEEYYDFLKLDASTEESFFKSENFKKWRHTIEKVKSKTHSTDWDLLTTITLMTRRKNSFYKEIAEAVRDDETREVGLTFERCLLKYWILKAVDKKELTLYFKNFIHDDKDMLKRLMDQLNEFPVSIETENLKKAVKEYIDVEPSYRYLARQLVVERQIVKERFVDLFPIRNTNGEKLLKHELFQTWDHLMTWNGEDFGQFILSRLRMQFSDPDIVHLLVKLESEHVASYSQIKVETALFAGLEANRNQNAMAALQIHRLYVEKGRDLLNTAQLRIALTYYQKKYAGRKVIKFKNFGQVRCTYHIIKGSSGNRDVLLREVIKVSSEPWQ
ncbi:hypothetical protein Plhal304r1_c018g0065941 [Plasmopara halstedii]